VRNCRALRLALRHCRSELRYLSNSTMGTQPGTMVPYLSTMILEQGTRSTYKATTRMWPHTQIESWIYLLLAGKYRYKAKAKQLEALQTPARDSAES